MSDYLKIKQVELAADIKMYREVQASMSDNISMQQLSKEGLEATQGLMLIIGQAIQGANNSEQVNKWSERAMKARAEMSKSLLNYSDSVESVSQNSESPTDPEAPTWAEAVGSRLQQMEHLAETSTKQVARLGQGLFKGTAVGLTHLAPLLLGPMGGMLNRNMWGGKRNYRGVDNPTTAGYSNYNGLFGDWKGFALGKGEKRREMETRQRLGLSSGSTGGEVGVYARQARQAGTSSSISKGLFHFFNGPAYNAGYTKDMLENAGGKKSSGWGFLKMLGAGIALAAGGAWIWKEYGDKIIEFSKPIIDGINRFRCFDTRWFETSILPHVAR